MPISALENVSSFSSKKRTIALLIEDLAFVMDLLDSTIVKIAITSIRTIYLKEFAELLFHQSETQ